MSNKKQYIIQQRRWLALAKEKFLFSLTLLIVIIYSLAPLCYSAEQESETSGMYACNEMPYDCDLFDYLFNRGDVNCNGYVDAADARKILRASASIDELNEEPAIYADVDADGKITASDARSTLRVAASIGRFNRVAYRCKKGQKISVSDLYSNNNSYWYFSTEMQSTKSELIITEETTDSYCKQSFVIEQADDTGLELLHLSLVNAYPLSLCYGSKETGAEKQFDFLLIYDK